MHLSDFEFVPLSNDIICTDFDCIDFDINEFIQLEALDYQKENMGNTYVFIDNNKYVKAYFTISNDSISDLGQTRNRFNKKNKIPNNKRISSYPAILLGRLGVSKEFHGTGLAYELMDFIKGWITIDSKPAVKFLVLDAYNQERQIQYYTRNGFDFLFLEDHKNKTRLMYYPLFLLNR